MEGLLSTEPTPSSSFNNTIICMRVHQAFAIPLILKPCEMGTCVQLNSSLNSKTKKKCEYLYISQPVVSHRQVRDKQRLKCFLIERTKY